MSDKLFKPLLLLCPFLLFNSITYAQSGTSTVRLVDWLGQLEQRYEVSFSYNNLLLSNLRVQASDDCTSLQNCLDLLQSNAPIKFDAIETGNILIIPVRSTAKLRIVEEGSNEGIISLRVKVNGQQEAYLLPQDNYYQIANLFPTDTVSIASQFFQSRKIAASELLALNTPLELSASTTYLSEVVVKDYLTTGVDTKLSDHSMQIDMGSLGLLAGESDGDILTVLKNIPGVRTPDGKPGSLNFRGSTFDQTLIYLDEIPIYHTGHFFGTISPYNPIAVDKVDIFRGTLPAKFGGRVGGLIDIKTDDPLSDSAVYSVAANTIYTAAKLKTPIVKDKLGLFFAIRSSYPYNNLPPKLQAFSDLNFQGSRIDPFFIDGNRTVLDRLDVRFRDINGKLAYRINNDHKFTLSFINIVNRFASDLRSDNVSLLQQQRLDLDNFGFTAKWKGQVSQKVDLSLGFTTSSLKILDNNDEFINGRAENQRQARNNLFDTRFIAEGNFKINQELQINSGYTFTNHLVEFDPILIESRVRQATTIQEEEADIHSVHIAVKKNWGTRVVLNAGIHSDYYEPIDQVYFDPRFSISFRASDHIYLKGSAGRSHQFIKQTFSDDFDDFRVDTQFWSLALKEDIPLEGLQGMIGMLYEKSNWLVDVEFYQKYTDNIDGRQGPDPNDDGSLTSTGADIFVKRKWSALETWVSYSISHVESEFDESNTAFFDQPHILNITNLLNVNRWNFAVSWGVLSGLPVVIPELDPEEPNSMGQTTLTVPYEDRFPTQHQLDLSATYSFHNKAKSWAGIVGISFLNVYNQENVINIFQDKTRVGNPFREAIGFAPNVNVKLTF